MSANDDGKKAGLFLPPHKAGATNMDALWRSAKNLHHICLSHLLTHP